MSSQPANLPQIPPSQPGPLSVNPYASLSPTQAGDLVRASIAGYGVMPDPQLSTEAMLMGSAPTLSSALASGDPSLQSAILSQPVGQSQFTAKGVSPPTALFNDPYTYDPKVADQMLQQYDEKGITNSFKSMGSLPMANLGWFNTITSGSPTVVKQWQQFLANQGFYGATDANGQNFKAGEVSGYTSPQFADAMKKWSLAFFLPQALFSRDPQELQNAQQFLSGLGYDPTAVASTLSHDPQQREKVIDSWLQAQGPDGNKVDALNAFADHFGAAALPDQLNSLRGDFAFSSVGNFLKHVPLLGSFIDHQQAHDLDQGLTDAEKQALQPSIQQAQKQSGLLGLVGGVLSAPSTALVIAGYLFKDAVTGQLGKDNINPFDDTSSVSKFVHDPTRELFGDQWAKDHPFIATLGNVTINIADDPLTFIPFVGGVKAAEAIVEGGGQLTKVEKATGGLISHRIGTLRTQTLMPPTIIKSLRNEGLKKTLVKTLDPVGNAQNEVSKMLASKSMTVGGIRQILHDYSLKDESVQAIDKLSELSKKGYQQGILTFLKDHQNGYADKMFDLSFLTNRNEYHKVLKNFDRLNQGKALHIWHETAMADSGSLINLKDSPGDAVAAVRDAAMAAGVGADKIAQFEDDFWHAGQSGDFHAGGFIEGMNKEIEKALDAKWKDAGGLAKFKDWRANLRSGSKQHERQGGVSYALEHDPTKPAVETSTQSPRLHFADTIEAGPAVAAALNGAVEHVYAAKDALQRDWQNAVDNKARQLSPDGVITEELRKQAAGSDELRLLNAQYANMNKGFADQLDEWKTQFGGKAQGGEGPTPMLPTQSFQWAALPYSATEIMAFSHKSLRNIETLQHNLGVDKAMNLWKSLVLTKPSTTLRVVFGDESSRFAINLMLNDLATFKGYMKSIATQRGTTVDAMVKDMPPELAAPFVAAMVSHQGVTNFVPMIAGDPGFKEGFTQLIENHYAKTDWATGYAKAVTDTAERLRAAKPKPLSAAAKTKKEQEAIDKAGRDAIRTSLLAKTEQGQMMREAHGLTNLSKTDNAHLDGLVETKLYDIKKLTNADVRNGERMDVLNWIQKGTVDQKRLKQMEGEFGVNGEYILPRIQSRPSVFADTFGKLSMPLHWYHSQLAQKWVGKARARGFKFKVDSELKRLKSFYVGPDGRATRTPEQLLDMARNSATQWVKKNTYQGARSTVGSTMRSVAPFWGATANSNRFYLRTLMEHPEVAIPAAQGEAAISQAQQTGGLRLHVPFFGDMLTKLGMSRGDSFTFEPFNSLFLTREGLGGFIPGMGPVFNVVAGASQQADLLSQLPGMQQLAGGSPMLPWLENMLSGVSLMTGHGGVEAPIIGRSEGYYKKLIDEKFQQQEADWEQGGRKGPAPTVQSAERDLGVNREVTGVAGFAAPLGLAAEDAKRSAILDIEKAWDPGLPAADKATLLATHPEVADYFKYLDPATPQQPQDGKDSKADILARSPWVLAYATGTGQSNVPGRATTGDTLKQYKNDVAAGDISTMDPMAYLTKVRTSEETSQAWNEFNRVQSAYQEFLQQSGVSSQSAAAGQWRRNFYDPAVKSLVNAYPDWGATFVKSTSRNNVGLQFASKPFYSVSTFDALPQNPALESKATILMRAAIIRRDQATSALEQVLANHGPQAEKDLILNGLAQQLDGLAAQDPAFAAQISRYRYTSVNDLITSQAQDQLLGTQVG